MQISSEPKPKSLLELKIELSPEEFSKYITKAVNHLAEEIKIPGFRPGKAPRDIVEKKIGSKGLLEEAAEMAVQDSFFQAIQEKQIKSLGSPKISLEKLAEGNPFVYTAQVAILPSIEIGNIASVKVEKKPAVIDPEKVEETLKGLQKMHSAEARANRPAKTGDRADVDFNVYLDNVPLDGGKGQNYPLTIGEKVFIPGFEEQIIGMKENEVKEFKLTFPKDYGKKDLQNKQADFKVTLKAVYDVSLPALDNDFAKKLGKFESMEDLRAKIQENLHQEAKIKTQQKFEQAMLEAVLTKCTIGELPEILIEAEADKMLHELEHAIGQDGGKFEDYLSSIKKSKDDLKKEFVPKAETRVKVALVLRTLADKENLNASDSEMEREISAESLRYSNQPEVLKQLQSEDYKDYLKMVLTNKKVISWLEKQVSVS
ncbi:MAG: trigger factor [Patescibacteria group bacterium]|jgi:trigger factor